MKNVLNGIVICVIVFMVLNIAAVGHAQDMGKKIYRGVVNTLTGWVELPKNVYVTSVEDSPLSSIGIGVVNGVKWMIVRTAVGVYETLTFPFPFPKGYAPIMEPEFAFTTKKTN